MKKKWFRFKGLYFGKRFGRENVRMELFAPTISLLKDKVATELAEKDIEPLFSAVDRVEIRLSKDEEMLSFSTLMRNVVNGTEFTRDVIDSDLYKELMNVKGELTG